MGVKKTKRNASQIGKYLQDVLLRNRNNKGRVRYGTHILRQSEEEALSETAQFLQDGIVGGHVIKPGGTGKTHGIVILSDAACRNTGKVLIVAPTTDAVDTIVKRFALLAPHIQVGIVYEAVKDYSQMVTVATYASLLIGIAEEKIKPEKYTLFVGDEGHHFLTDLSDETLDKFTNAVKIAFTATPRYYAGKEVAASKHFRQLFYNLTYKEAVARKECAPTKPRLIETNIPLDEYERLFANGLQPSEDSGEYERAINQVPWNQTFANLYGTYEDEETGHRLVGDKAVLFCSGIQHAKDMARECNDMWMPYINGISKCRKAGQEIRSVLKAKGIDPDKVKHVCIPVWGSMDREGGWSSEPTGPSYTRKQALEALINGESLTLSCDKLLAESIDIPAITTILNAVPSGSYVRAGQRGMRASRIYKGNRALGIPPKTYAYVFDGLPLNWQTSFAAPVLFSEFVLKDLYTMHGVEPPTRKQGLGKAPVPEQNPGYRVLWDVQTLLSVGAMMEKKRSIAKAEVVPEEFLNDSLAVLALTRQHENLPPETPRFVGGIYKEWEAAYEAVCKPETGTVSRYKYSIPAEHFRFANNRLYIHRDSLPVIWAERQEFKTPRGMVNFLKENGHFPSPYDIGRICNLLRTFWAGDYRPHEYVSPNDRISQAYADRENSRIRQDHETKIRLLSSVDSAVLRNYEGKDFLSTDLLPIFKELIPLNEHAFSYREEEKARKERKKGWVSIVTLIDELADKGFAGLGRNELFAHATAAARAAEKGETYGGEDFYPGDFQFSSQRNDEQPTHLPSGRVLQIHIRSYRIESFIDALTHFNPPSYAEPSIFPAKISECYPALRKASGGELNWINLAGIINRMLNRDSGHNDAERQARLKIAFDLSRDDIVLPRSPDGDMRLTRHGYESFKNLFAIRPPDGFIHHSNIHDCVRKIIGSSSNYSDYHNSYRISYRLHSALANDPERVGTVEIAGISIPLKDLWKRDPYGNVASETVIKDKGMYYNNSIVPKIVALEVATIQATRELRMAFSAVVDSQIKNVTVRGIQVPVAPHYISHYNKLHFRMSDVSIDLFLRVVENILKQTQEQTVELSSGLRDGLRSPRASRRSLQTAQP